MQNSLDEKVNKLFEIVKVKKEQIKKLDRPSFKTNLSLKTFEDGTVNLHAQNRYSLVRYFSYLQREQSSFQQANLLLGTNEIFTNNGFTFDEWTHDFKILVEKVLINDLKKDLADKEKKLNSLLSEDQRRQIQIEELEKDLAT